MAEADEKMTIDKVKMRTKAEFFSHQHQDKATRLEFLLKQTEIFSHFMKSSIPGSAAQNPQNNALGEKNKELEEPIGTVENIQDHDTGLITDDRGQGLSEGEAGEPTFTSSPPYIKGGTMRDYQIAGLNWMISLHNNGLSGILADEMGLGKTLQTISLLGYLLHHRNIPGPHLIVVPTSTLTNWTREFEQWCPSLKAICLSQHRPEREEFIDKIFKKRKWNVCITSYSIFLLEVSLLKRQNWHYVIVDEAQRIKNDKALMSKNLRLFRSSSRLLLTGTPLQNNLHELWSLLNFLLPDVFSSSDDFDSWFNIENCLVGDTELVSRLRSILQPFLLRRMKTEVEKFLPLKKETKVYVGLTKMQREWYMKAILHDHYEYLCNGDGMKPTHARLNATLIQTLKVCNHPYIFPGAEQKPYSDSTIALHSGKMVVLDKLLPKLKAEGSRILLFCSMVRMMDILEDYCRYKRYKYYRLDGNTKVDERQKSIDEFNSPKSKAFMFLISTRAGGVGINLATANVVILYDSDWNPQVDLQAIDRAHRIGQQRDVRIFRLITENSVEVKMVERAEVRLKLDQNVIQVGNSKGPAPPNFHDILSIVKFGMKDINSAGKEEYVVSDEYIDSLLENSKITSAVPGETTQKRLQSLQKEKGKDGPAKENEAPMVNIDALKSINTCDFEGTDYREMRNENRKAYKREMEAVVLMDSRQRRSFLNGDGPAYAEKGEEEFLAVQKIGRKSIRTLKSIKSHEDYVKTASKISKPFECENCGKRYMSQKNLDNHYVKSCKGARSTLNSEDSTLEPLEDPPATTTRKGAITKSTIGQGLPTEIKIVLPTWMRNIGSEDEIESIDIDSGTDSSQDNGKYKRSSMAKASTSYKKLKKI